MPFTHKILTWQTQDHGWHHLCPSVHILQEGQTIQTTRHWTSWWVKILSKCLSLSNTMINTQTMSEILVKSMIARLLLFIVSTDFPLIFILMISVLFKRLSTFCSNERELYQNHRKDEESNLLQNQTLRINSRKRNGFPVIISVSENKIPSHSIAWLDPQSIGNTLLAEGRSIRQVFCEIERKKKMEKSDWGKETEITGLMMKEDEKRRDRIKSWWMETLCRKHYKWKKKRRKRGRIKRREETNKGQTN